MNIDYSKVSTELNVALNTSLDEREKSLDLNVGYNQLENRWELIIKYIGSLENIGKELEFTYVELLNGYAIVSIREDLIEKLSNYSEIIYIEKPKNIYVEANGNPRNLNGFSESCMDLVNTDYISLTGRGTMVAVIDSGIDYRHPAFIRNNSSRIIELWDQSTPGNPPFDYMQGTVYSRDDINVALNGDNIRLLTYDSSGHGTAVTSIITYCVPDADILVVKLDDNKTKGIPNTISLMLAIDYVVRKSIELRVPAVLNLSYGNNYGNHASDSMLEEYIDSIAVLTRLNIVVGTGNDGEAQRHAQVMLGNTPWESIEFQVYEYMTGMNLQIWQNYVDNIDIMLITPDGTMLGPFLNNQEVANYNIRDMNIVVQKGYPNPFNRNLETYVSFIPKREYIETGIWKVLIRPKSITDGRVDMWLPVLGSTSAEVRFLQSSEYTTLTIPSTARNTITVGAYNPQTLAYAGFSGRGYTATNEIKPDIVAPGVDIQVATPGGGYIEASGTSFAAPFVSAAASMLMEYGIVQGRDPYLYGEKLKSNLIRGARKLPAYSRYPNPYVGWGALCVSDSLPNY